MVRLSADTTAPICLHDSTRLLIPGSTQRVEESPTRMQLLLARVTETLMRLVDSIARINV